MRRKEKEITAPDEIREILEACTVCRLAMCNHDMPYLVPLNFGYTYEDGSLTLYFHSAPEGKKLEIMRKNPCVCFEMDCDHQVIPGEKACAYSFGFRSIIGSGKVKEVVEGGQKAAALRKLMEKVAGEGTVSFDEHVLARTCVLELKAETFTAKGRQG